MLLRSRQSIPSIPSLLGLAMLSLATVFWLGGCGVLTARNLDFETAETGENGQVYVIDDLRDIAGNADLTEDEKRQAFYDLGIEDEDLITALLQL